MHSRVILFSGHRVDAPGRSPPRFPADRVAAAGTAIGAALDELGSGPHDRALTQGAAGGDLLFAQACIDRGVPLQFIQPLPEPAFIEASVRASGSDWESSYASVRARLVEPPRVGQADAGAAGGDDPYVRCNMALLDAAFASGGPVEFICLWDGGTGDGPGGTAHMVAEVRGRGGRTTWIDTRRLDPASAPAPAPPPDGHRAP